LIARIYEVFPWLCSNCVGQMRVIASQSPTAQISQPPHIAPARGPPLWDDGDAQMGDGVVVEPDWDLAAQPAPDQEVDRLLLVVNLAHRAAYRGFTWLEGDSRVRNLGSCG